MTYVRVSIGESGENAEVSPESIAIFQSNERYFADFETYLLAVMGFAQILNSHQDDLDQQSAAMRGSDTVLIACKQSPAGWFWRPLPTIQMYCKNCPPPFIALERKPRVQPDSTDILTLGALGNLLFTFGQSLGVNYYERHKGDIYSRYGKPENWPMVWRFARVVRNAMAHNGKIDITGKGETPVLWRNLEYSSADNGRLILHSDLWPGDLFDLIVELDQTLPPPEPPRFSF